MDTTYGLQAAEQVLLEECHSGHLLLVHECFTHIPMRPNAIYGVWRDISNLKRPYVKPFGYSGLPHAHLADHGERLARRRGVRKVRQQRARAAQAALHALQQRAHALLAVQRRAWRAQGTEFVGE